MKSIVILWNTVQNLETEMLEDLSNFCEINKIFKLQCGQEYEKFVRACYESENMEKWKIDNKLEYMLLNSNRDATILLVDIDKGPVIYHEKKKKNIYSNIQNTKDFMRNKYKEKIDNYYFDIVFHSTDNETEYKNLQTSIYNFIKNSKVKINQIAINESLTK